LSDQLAAIFKSLEEGIKFMLKRNWVASKDSGAG
jgi:hypothetical protein